MGVFLKDLPEGARRFERATRLVKFAAGGGSGAAIGEGGRLHGGGDAADGEKGEEVATPGATRARLGVRTPRGGKQLDHLPHR